MGILKTGAKVVGTAVLGATGIASSLVRTTLNVANAGELADIIGKVEDASFETIKDIWTPEEMRDDKYYEDRERRIEMRAESSAREGERRRREYERRMEEYQKNR